MQLFKNETNEKFIWQLPLLCCRHNLSVKKVTDDKTIEDLSKKNLIKNKVELLTELKKNLNYPSAQIFIAQQRGKTVGIATLNTSTGIFSNNKTASLDIKIKNDPSIDKSMINDLLIDNALRYAKKRDDIVKIVHNNREISFSKDLTYHKLSNQGEIEELTSFTKDVRNADNKPVNEEKFIKTLKDNIDNPLFKVFTAKKSGKIVGLAEINVIQDPSMSGYITAKFNFSNKDINPREMKSISEGLIRRIEDYTKSFDKEIYAIMIAVPNKSNGFGTIIRKNGYKPESTGYFKNINKTHNLQKHSSLAAYANGRNLLPEKMPQEILELFEQKLPPNKAIEKFNRYKNKLQKVKTAFPEMVIDTIKDTDYEKLSMLYKDLNGGVEKHAEKLKKLMHNASENSDYIVIGIRGRKDGEIIASISLEKHPDLSGDCRPYIHTENLVVDKNYKNNGLATTLLLAIYKILYDNDCNGKFLGDNWRISRRFYRNSLFGFEVESDYYEKQIKKIELPKGYRSVK